MLISLGDAPIHAYQSVWGKNEIDLSQNDHFFGDGLSDSSFLFPPNQTLYLIGLTVLYLLLVNSGAQHELLRKELQHDFTKGSDKYPENCPQTLLFLDRYSKSIPADGGSQGTAFAQKAGKVKKDNAKKACKG
jgi:hypothetical protein